MIFFEALITIEVTDGFICHKLKAAHFVILRELFDRRWNAKRFPHRNRSSAKYRRNRKWSTGKVLARVCGKSAITRQYFALTQWGIIMGPSYNNRRDVLQNWFFHTGSACVVTRALAARFPTLVSSTRKFVVVKTATGIVISSIRIL